MFCEGSCAASTLTMAPNGKVPPVGGPQPNSAPRPRSEPYPKKVARCLFGKGTVEMDSMRKLMKAENQEITQKFRTRYKPIPCESQSESKVEVTSTGEDGVKEERPMPTLIAKELELYEKKHLECRTYEQSVVETTPTSANAKSKQKVFGRVSSSTNTTTNNNCKVAEGDNKRYKQSNITDFLPKCKSIPPA